MINKSLSVEPYLVEWFLLIRPEQISWLRFILEGYDGLAILTTISAKIGLVRLHAFNSSFAEAMRLIESLSVELTPFYPYKSN
jgi:hypothetical protein